MRKYIYYKKGKEVTRGTIKEIAEYTDLTEGTLIKYNSTEQRRAYENKTRGSAVYEIPKGIK